MKSFDNLPTFIKRQRQFAALIVLVLICLAGTGCQYLPFLRSDGEPPPSQEPAPSAPDRQSVSVQRAMTLLQNGREDDAEAMLERIVDSGTGNATARLLLAQIRQPPAELLGEDYEEIVVEPGDSLSEIARRTMNNELLFYALARLNDIEVPRLLQAGQRLRVPRLEMPEAAENDLEEVDAGPDTGKLPSSRQLAETAGRLMDSERVSQAYALLLSAARAGKLDEGDAVLLSRSAVALADSACQENDPERAMKYLNQASPWIGGLAEEGAFPRQLRHIQSRMALDEAENRLARGNYESAYDALVSVREQNESLSDTHGERLGRLTSALSTRFHDRALSAWRDQRVAESVELWERVVRIDPDFVPAQRYLRRARRAQQELKKLGGG